MRDDYEKDRNNPGTLGGQWFFVVATPAPPTVTVPAAGDAAAPAAVKPGGVAPAPRGLGIIR